jgi:hypothetical protein
MANAFSRCDNFATPSTPSYCPVSKPPMAVSASSVDCTTQPASRATLQIRVMPQSGPQTRGTPAAPATSAAAAGQSGRSRSRRPRDTCASRSRQNSETIVTIVQPTCSGRSPARSTSCSASSRKPLAERTSVGTPTDFHGAARSAASARRRARAAGEAGQACSGPLCSTSRREAAATAAVESCTVGLRGRKESIVRWAS